MKVAGRMIILGCALAVGVFAQTDAEGTAKSKIVALEQAWNQAYKSGDTKAPTPRLFYTEIL